jgi:hypothetical protein
MTILPCWDVLIAVGTLNRVVRGLVPPKRTWCCERCQAATLAAGNPMVDKQGALNDHRKLASQHQATN